MFKLTLSFDNGPEPEVTRNVLEVLQRAGIRSTFFVLGSRLAHAPRLFWPNGGGGAFRAGISA